MGYISKLIIRKGFEIIFCIDGKKNIYDLARYTGMTYQHTHDLINEFLKNELCVKKKVFGKRGLVPSLTDKGKSAKEYCIKLRSLLQCE